MIPVLFINCDLLPFLDQILNLDKILETRSRNMLRALIGQRVFLAETHRGKRPIIRGSAIIGHPIVTRSRDDWEQFRSMACIPSCCPYDWQPDTKAKYLYPLIGVEPVTPFSPPEGVRHGRVWMEYQP